MLQRFIAIVGVQICLSMMLVFKGGEYLDTYIASVLPVLFLVMLMIILSRLHDYGTWDNEKQSFVMRTGILLNMGIALQAISVGDANYINKMICASVVVGIVFILLMKKLVNKMKYKNRVILFTSILFLIYLLLTITSLSTTFGDTTTDIVIGGISLKIVLLCIPLFCLSISSIYSMQVSQNTGYFSTLVITMMSLMFLVLLNELGTAMVIITLFMIGTFQNYKKKYSALNILGSVLGGGIGGSILYIGYLCYENGNSQNGIITLFYSIYVKLETRFGAVFNLFENENNYQLIKAREAISVGGLFGSSIDVVIPVAVSDFAFPLSILKFGIIFGIIFVVILILTLQYVEYVAYVGGGFERSVATLFLYSICLQSLFTIWGSTAMFPLSGMPILFLSKSGMYFVIVMLQLFYILSVEKVVDQEREESKEWKAEKRIQRKIESSSC